MSNFGGKKMKKQIEFDENELGQIEQMRGKQIYVVMLVKSGTSRHLAFYIKAPEYERLVNVTFIIAKLTGYKLKEGRIVVTGGGMDLIFNVLSNLNYIMARRDTGKTIQELLKTGECGVRIYDNYFVNADNYQLLGG